MDKDALRRMSDAQLMFLGRTGLCDVVHFDMCNRSQQDIDEAIEKVRAIKSVLDERHSDDNKLPRGR